MIENIIPDIQKYLIKLAKEHNFIWFYDLHQLEVVKSAGLLLEKYPKADKDIIILSCWLHDIKHFMANGEKEIEAIKPNHHIEGAVEARKILNQYNLPEEKIGKVCKCIERHRNRPGYEPVSIEEKIVASADALSHFYSVFFLTFFKVHPSTDLNTMVDMEKEKIERDWRDVNILPEAGKIAEMRYMTLRGMLDSYKSNFKEYHEDN